MTLTAEDIKILRRGEHWHSSSMNYGAISIISHQGEYPPRSGIEGIEIRDLWDHRHGDLVERVMPLIPEDKEEEFKTQIWNSTDPQYSLWMPVMGEFADNSDTELYADVYRIAGRIPVLLEFAKEWAADVLKSGQEAHGDDTYFDYFPDLMDCFYQYCLGLSHLLENGNEIMHQIYEGVVEELYREGGNYDRQGDFADEVSFPEW